MVSVIVPVHNAEKFLSDAIESVIAQSYNDWELILINDGSSDQSAAICDRFASQHSNIKVLHQNNKGVSAARNVGIGVAQGEFVAFMDADDVIAPEYLQHLCDQQKKYDADLVGTWREFVDEDLHPLNRVNFSHDAYYDADSLHFLVRKNPDFFFVVWGNLYRKHLIEKYEISFNEKLNFGEDNLFMSCYAAICKKSVCDSKKLYYYRQHSNSLKNHSANWLEQKILGSDHFLAFADRYIVKETFRNEISMLNLYSIIRAIIDSDFSLIQMKENLTNLHNSEIYFRYLKHFKIRLSNIVCICIFMMRRIPCKIQPYIFEILHMCKQCIDHFRNHQYKPSL